VFRAAFLVLDKLYHISRFTTGKAVVGVGVRVYFATGGVVIVEGAFYVVVLVGLYAVMCQQFQDGQPLFDVVYFHFSMIFSAYAEASAKAVWLALRFPVLSVPGRRCQSPCFAATGLPRSEPGLRLPAFGSGRGVFCGGY